MKHPLPGCCVVGKDRSVILRASLSRAGGRGPLLGQLRCIFKP
jgi:hypothetical protein